MWRETILYLVKQVLALVLLIFCLIGMSTCYESIVGRKNVHMPDDRDQYPNP